MSNPGGIVVCGLNGSGKTTLGRELASILGLYRVDVEDYWFDDAEIPYSKPRELWQVAELMLADIRERGDFVLSGVTGNYGSEIPSFFKLAVRLDAPLDLRMKRLAQRAYEKFGERVRPGGDMFEQECVFMEMAAWRRESRVDNWLETLSCPVIRLDGAQDFRVSAEIVAAEWRKVVGASDS